MNGLKRLLIGFALALSALPTLAQEKTFAEAVGPVRVGEVSKNSTPQVPFIFWGGDVATFYANGGLQTANGSIYSNLNVRVNLTPGDNFVAQVKDYMTGKSPFLRCTMGMLAMASEVIGSDPRTKPVVFLHMTWSKGDHLVVKNGIKTLTDLKGKTIALQSYGPHVDLLDIFLKAGGLNRNDVKIVWCEDLSGDGDSPPSVFKKRSNVDAAFVITPDMLAITGGLQNTGSGVEGTIKGSRVVASTSEFSRAIADVYVCRKDYFDSNRDFPLKFSAGYMKACEDIMEAQKAYATKGSKEYTKILQLAQNIFGKQALPTLDEDAAGLLLDAVFVGYPGNVVFFTEENNPIGFQAKSNEVLEMALASGITRVRSGFFSANFDYSGNAFVGYLKETKVNQGNRFRGEAVQKEIEDLSNGTNLDDRTLISFTIQFEPNQTTLNADTYGQEFKRVVEVLSKAGNAVIAIRGHSDPTKTLADCVKAGISKGTLKQSGSSGNYTYSIEGRPFDLSNTKAVLKFIDDGGFDGAPNGINPRETAQEALNLSKKRAEQVKQVIIAYAKENNLTLDPTQIQPVGVGAREPFISKPKNAGEAAQNMRVEFRLVRIVAEPTKDGDFDF